MCVCVYVSGLRWTRVYLPTYLPPVSSQRWVKGALQLLSKRYRYIRFAQVPERISISSSDGDHQRFILDLPMKPGTIRNKWLRSWNWNRRSLWVTAPKSLVQFDYETAASIYLGPQSTFNPNPGLTFGPKQG